MVQHNDAEGGQRRNHQHHCQNGACVRVRSVLNRGPVALMICVCGCLTDRRGGRVGRRRDGLAEQPVVGRVDAEERTDQRRAIDEDERALVGL